MGSMPQSYEQWDEGGVVDAVRVEVDFLQSETHPTVRIEHRLTRDSDAGNLRLFLLQLGTERIEGLEVRVDGEAVPLDLDLAARGRLEGAVPLREVGASDPVAQPRPSAPLIVELRYRVRDAGLDSRNGNYYRVPLVLPRWRPSNSGPDFFVAEALIPHGRAVSESFPTVPPEVTVEEDVQRVTLTLQTVPSILRYQLDVGEPRFFTVARSVDLGVFLILCLLGVGAARVLRRDFEASAAEDQ